MNQPRAVVACIDNMARYWSDSELSTAAAAAAATDAVGSLATGLSYARRCRATAMKLSLSFV